MAAHIIADRQKKNVAEKQRAAPEEAAQFRLPSLLGRKACPLSARLLL